MILAITAWLALLLQREGSKFRPELELFLAVLFCGGMTFVLLAAAVVVGLGASDFPCFLFAFGALLASTGVFFALPAVTMLLSVVRKMLIDGPSGPPSSNELQGSDGPTPRSGVSEPP